MAKAASDQLLSGELLEYVHTGQFEVNAGKVVDRKLTEPEIKPP